MVSVGQHEKIELLSYSEVEEVSGYVGNFGVTVRRKARYVDESLCTGCGQCVQVCPFNAISLNPDSGIATVDESLCRGCGTCAGTCRVSAITTKGYSDLQMLSLLNSI